jgi:hypothetical protein
MKLAKFLCIGLTAFLLFGFVWGCADQQRYGRTMVTKSVPTIEALYENWSDYEVYVQAASPTLPIGIIFDLKEDGKKITYHNFWTPVKDKEELDMFIRRLKNREGRLYVQEIRDPDKQVYGYLYSLPVNPLIKRINDETIWIDRIGF